MSTKISQLPGGSTPTGVETFPAVQGGQTVAFTLLQAADYTATQIDALTAVNLLVPTGFSAASSEAGGVQTSTITYSSGQPPNQFLATPASGSGALGLRSIAQSDLPSPLPAANGGTGLTGYATGDLLYASGATTLSVIAPGTSGNALVSQGPGVAPTYASIAGTSSKGTFSATLGGFVSNPSLTVYYNVTGNICSLYIISTVSGTASSSTGMTLFNLPSALTPPYVLYVPCGQLINNGISNIMGMCEINGNALQLLVGTVTGSYLVNGSFTASATKGLGAGWTIVYPLQ